MFVNGDKQGQNRYVGTIDLNICPKQLAFKVTLTVAPFETLGGEWVRAGFGGFGSHMAIEKLK